MSQEKITIIWEVDEYRSAEHFLQFPKEDWDELTDDEKDELVCDQAMGEIRINWKVKP